MTQLEQPITSSRKNSALPLLFGLVLVIVLGALVAFVIRSINREQQLQAQIAGLERQLNNKSTVDSLPSTASSPRTTDDPSTSSGQAVNQQPEDQPTANQITPTTWVNSPSKPSQTHSVGKGETLFSIGQKYSIEWTNIVVTNGLPDENLIKAGDILVIPTVDVKSEVNQVDFTVDTEKAKTVQAQAASTNPWRLDPIEVAKRESGGLYGVKIDDQWVLGNKDGGKGQATVRVASGDKHYEISLTQPVDKGEQGIWAVTSVKPVK